MSIQNSAFESNGPTGPSSPEFGASSTSTLVREDDTSSLPNASSESTWENKSQTSNIADKAADSEKAPQHEKKKQADKDRWTKPLQDAPPPPVNVWKQRAEQAKSKGSTATGSDPAVGQPTEKSVEAPSTASSKKIINGEPETTHRHGKASEDEKLKPRRERRSGDESEKSRKQVNASGAEKGSLSAPLPSMRDQESWPTPLSLQDERRKVQPKSEKAEKEPVETNPPAASKGKNAWVTLAFTPTVVFNTPLPNANSRRGGRTGSRGGKDSGNRGGVFASTGPADRAHPSQAPLTNGETHPRRGRAARSSSPARTKRASSGSPVSRKDTRSAGHARETSTKDPSAEAQTSRHTEASVVDEGGSPKEGVEKKAGAGPESAFKGNSAERRNPYPSFPNRERVDNRGRGGARGGRSGAHTYHGSSHQFVNGVSSAQPPSFGLPRSPTYQADGFYGAGPQPGRGFRNGPNRAQSIPADGPFRGANGFPGNPLMHPLNTFMASNTGYEYPGMVPMSAVQVSPYMEIYSVMGMVSTQLEYYFSVDNLCKDIYLRKHMDSQGFVLLSVIADFNRVKSLTSDIELIKHVCQQSPNLEHRIGADGQDRLRTREGWEKWPLPMADRDPSAQNAGPEVLHMPPIPQPQGFDPRLQMHRRVPSGPVSAGAVPFQSVNGAQPLCNGYGLDGSADVADPHMVKGSGASTMSPAVQGTVPVNGISEQEPDLFSDEKTESLKILSRKSPVPKDLLAQFDRRQSGRKLSRINSNISEEGAQGHQPSIYMKDKSASAHERPPDSFSELYTNFRAHALEERIIPGSTPCPYDMDVLYQFWSHFLVRNFNARMYHEFKSLAEQDAVSRGSYVGRNNLIHFYGQALALQDPIRLVVARHYVELVRNEPTDGDRHAFKQLRTAWRDGALNMKNRKRIRDYISPELEAELDG
ncbi:hypothetical protein EJ06DRAFT_475206 [Trichodelitschia bisporula]|uniref:HTH La-type RNA-binding domain-containing protein n=1 Tax=Trichodelitschia bisporula TaxID=703511 RepID=A0A6G1HZV3_9PEZI|nr:hypothetical protein EJ06DRAFT_475206 [Trichodelitschia bisporula]